VNTPRSYEEDSWFNIQWKLFLFGLVLFVPSCIGVVLPAEVPDPRPQVRAPA